MPASSGRRQATCVMHKASLVPHRSVVQYRPIILASVWAVATRPVLYDTGLVASRLGSPPAAVSGSRRVSTRRRLALLGRERRGAKVHPEAGAPDRHSAISAQVNIGRQLVILIALV